MFGKLNRHFVPEPHHADVSRGMNVQSPEPTKPLLLLDVDGPINPFGQMTKHGTLVSKPVSYTHLTLPTIYSV